MKKIKSLVNYFSKGELALWLCSEVVIIAANILLGKNDYTSVIASMIGVTALIFNAKGNPMGPALMVFFSIFYGYISFTFRYYGEMLTYLGMSMPMAIISLISWLKNPYNGHKSEVTVNRYISKCEQIFMWTLTIAVTIAFYFILKAFNTANIIPSTVSVGTSFVAVYLSFRRSPFFALGYAVNDIVLIILWILASFHDVSYLSVVICFIAFLANDTYSFINWQRMSRRQALGICTSAEPA